MKHQDLLKQMQDTIGVQDPIVYFDKFTQLLGLLFDRLDTLETQVQRLGAHVSLAIQWDPKVASNMLAQQIKTLKRADKDIYTCEIAALQAAYTNDHITQEYSDFCTFWQEVLGYHPFMDYE